MKLPAATDDNTTVTNSKKTKKKMYVNVMCYLFCLLAAAIQESHSFVMMDPQNQIAQLV